MALSMLVALIAAPALLGTQEAIRQSQSKEKREEHRARRCNLIASCVTSSLRSREINGRPIVLRDGKLWIDTGTSSGARYGHPYAGYYLPYPDTTYEGLVTTITDAAPVMNWVYIDRVTHEVKYGVRADAQPNLTGPFDCTRQDRRLTFDAWEGWCAVEEFPTLWALYYDLDDDGLRGKVAEGTRVLEIELSRKEKRFAKEGVARMQDQSTQRKVDATGATLVDEPVGGQTEVKRPGAWGVEAKESEQRDQSVPGPEPLKPFVIPKMSLFEDLPYSVTKIPPIPPTPPPAYSTTVPIAPPPAAENPIEEFERNDTLRESTTPLSEAQSRFSPPPPPEPSSLEEDNASSPSSTSVPVPSAAQPVSLHLRTAATAPPPLPASLRLRPSSNQRQRTPPTRPPRSPQATSPNQNTSSTEKRTTPRLNRNSGTRAIAQAQMFEAWARGQTAEDLSSNYDDTSPPRPVSAAESSASEYSNLAAEEQSRERKRTSTKKSDPAVFGGFITPPDTTKERNETARRSGRISAEYKIQRKTSITTPTDTGVSKGRLGSDRRPPSNDRARTTSTEQARRPRASQTSSRGVTSSIGRNKAESPKLNRGPSTAKPPTKITTRTAQNSRYSPPPAPPLPRSASVSSQRSLNLASSARASPTPRPLTRTTTSPAPASTSTGRKGMTATMTSGTRNRAMTLRIGGREAISESPPGLQRSRTNSSLYREIGDLVGGTGGREEGRRVPPPGRRGTSRDNGDDAVRDARKDVLQSKRRDSGEKRF